MTDAATPETTTSKQPVRWVRVALWGLLGLFVAAVLLVLSGFSTVGCCDPLRQDTDLIAWVVSANIQSAPERGDLLGPAGPLRSGVYRLDEVLPDGRTVSDAVGVHPDDFERTRYVKSRHCTIYLDADHPDPGWDGPYYEVHVRGVGPTGKTRVVVIASNHRDPIIIEPSDE